MGCITFEHDEAYCLKSMYEKMYDVNKMLKEKFGIHKIDDIIKIFK